MSNRWVYVSILFPSLWQYTISILSYPLCTTTTRFSTAKRGLACTIHVRSSWPSLSQTFHLSSSKRLSAQRTLLDRWPRSHCMGRLLLHRDNLRVHFDLHIFRKSRKRNCPQSSGWLCPRNSAKFDMGALQRHCPTTISNPRVLDLDILYILTTGFWKGCTRRSYNMLDRSSAAKLSQPHCRPWVVFSLLRRSMRLERKMGGMATLQNALTSPHPFAHQTALSRFQSWDTKMDCGGGSDGKPGMRYDWVGYDFLYLCLFMLFLLGLHCRAIITFSHEKR